ncbi:class I SAM-dependent methyltransferase [Clostridium bowmanii]|uniref:class I SAM-dependent methyltransferase n=1 Tax=Clostridium bowmanii TaxID=132925 RepID=UPI001C0B107B|nr:class I SAM-dependent methyltransferase [Clostridium bowmanii]MBU3190616.1 class I SAM-dependent methyltransferase [Clostridium bowmanii]MCA1075149.1 class I SAM-dependent methyltransferase [Clostridium bowmanii]
MKTFDDMWEVIHQEQEWGKYPSEEVIRFVARNFYKLDRKKIRVLDFGCGTGAVTWYIAKEGFDAYGFDGSETAIKKAIMRIEQEGLKANLLVADAGNLSYEDNHFDAIVDSAVICGNKLYDVKNILTEAKRVLKEGGKIFSTGLFNCKTTGYGTGEKLEEGTYREMTEGALAHRGTVHFFTVNEIKSTWEEAGFKNVKIDSVERTDMGGEYTIGFFIVEAEK